MAQSQGRNAYRQELTAELDGVFPASLFRGMRCHGNERWTPRLVAWLSVIMFWVSGNTLEEQFSTARRIVKLMKPHWQVPVSSGGFVAAQLRWWPQLGPVLTRRLRPDAASAGAAWRLGGWLVLAVDGSRFECPRTAANEQGLGCAGREKTAPQIFQTLLQHVGTGLPWDYRLGPGTDSERRHLDEMLADLPEQTLLTADAGFISYDLCAQLIDANTFFVLRIGGNKTLLENLEGEEQPDERSVYLWPDQARPKPPLKVRRICFPSAGGLPVVLYCPRRSLIHCRRLYPARQNVSILTVDGIITNVLDAQLLSDEDTQQIYRSRWGIEVYFRHLKQTMGFTTLRSRTPATAWNEHHWRLISFWMLQRMAVSQHIAAGQDPRRCSAATAHREIREVLQLMQQGKYQTPLNRRWLKTQTDSYQRHGPQATGHWPRKKHEQPPKPPKTRPATASEIQKAKQLGFKFLLIS
ncbi:MAG: IS4 family transposase [Planctomycetaceae bacterium]